MLLLLSRVEQLLNVAFRRTEEPPFIVRSLFQLTEAGFWAVSVRVVSEVPETLKHISIVARPLSSISRRVFSSIFEQLVEGRIRLASSTNSMRQTLASLRARPCSGSGSREECMVKNGRKS
jgi:hypothetical protein